MNRPSTILDPEAEYLRAELQGKQDCYDLLTEMVIDLRTNNRDLRFMVGLLERETSYLRRELESEKARNASLEERLVAIRLRTRSEGHLLVCARFNCDHEVVIDRTRCNWQTVARGPSEMLLPGPAALVEEKTSSPKPPRRKRRRTEDNLAASVSGPARATTGARHSSDCCTVRVSTEYLSPDAMLS
jgi:hypothetical protein